MYIVYIERDGIIKEFRCFANYLNAFRFCYDNNYEFVDENGDFWDMYFKKEGESDE